MFTREKIEALEEKNLAPYAMKSKFTAGRKHEEPQCAHRTCYQRDRDRIVHSEAFRKLEYKTQVFVIFEGDYYRTRLTHTIEVAQIARSIGRSLQLNEDLIEAIALAHDLGHSPFGHAGESALNLLMEGVGGFNHNFHSFEIVTEIEKRYPCFNGLNLSQEVLIGILKHETDYDDKGDVEEYRNIGPTFEANVVDVADGLAYLSHDIDDGMTSGCIAKEDLIESELWHNAASKIESTLEKNNIEMFKYQIVRALIDMQIKDMLVYSNEKLEEVGFKSSDEVKDYNLKKMKNVIIGYSPEMKMQRDFLQKLVNEKLYGHYRVERMTSKASRILNDLFEVYKKNPKQLPYDVYPRDRIYSEAETRKIICNHIALMTDRFALDEHKKLFNPYQKV
ncbi:MAG: deoxyguanosinetriphosphate triphosphohydrolase [Candidatus Omnitrophica bacterium]|nr:deoxyguanosinetriphosphate triphosphohydrolase [Candidatus Omnitrophota bacterium]MBU1996314.1 deoxyguanosinetriphosphate triphosphohydrolase [Candidatus Omnitrophota bacterium]MBU4334403.1 deoxyguanosinetriphosphate triphosphohydrolase [Candidatus Omnitrophota bacterium]